MVSWGTSPVLVPYLFWIPAFAGMTARFTGNLTYIYVCSQSTILVDSGRSAGLLPYTAKSFFTGPACTISGGQPSRNFLKFSINNAPNCKYFSLYA